MPIFVRAGSIVPVGPDLQYTGEKAADPIRLYVFTGRDCSFTLYEDEGTNYNYEQGRYASIPLSYDDAHQTLTIGAREGTFAGMLLTRTFEIVWVKGQNASAPDFSRPPDRKITYDGSQQIVAVGSTGH
jgi:alpha-D-xyloside xylohydrolase